MTLDARQALIISDFHLGSVDRRMFAPSMVDVGFERIRAPHLRVLRTRTGDGGFAVRSAADPAVSRSPQLGESLPSFVLPRKVGRRADRRL